MPRRRLSAFTLVELLVVIAIIGILVALLLPAIQAAREAARRIECTNKVKQLVLALHNYHDTHNLLPPGTLSSTKVTYTTSNWCGSGSLPQSRAPWTVLILPYLEKTTQYEQFDFATQFTSTSNVPGSTRNNEQFKTSNASYQCPSDIASKPDNNNGCYMGVQGGGITPNCSTSGGLRVFFTNGVLYHNSNTGIGDILDGTSNVLMVGETKYCLDRRARPDGFHSGWASAGKLDAWGSPLILAGAQEQINAWPKNGTNSDTLNYMTRMFGSHHPGGCQFGVGDGSAHFVSDNIDINLLRQLAARDDGMPMGGLPQ